MVKARKTISAKTKGKLTAIRDHMVQAAGHVTDLLGDDEAGETGNQSEEDVKMEKSELLEVLEARDANLLKSVGDLIDEKVARIAATDTTAPAVEAAPVEPLVKSAEEGTAPAEGGQQGTAVAADQGSGEVAELRNMIKSLTETVETIAGQARKGGPALNDLATHAVRRGGTPADVSASPEEEAFIKAQESGNQFEIERSGQALMAARLKALAAK
jgi:hypothetical protein